MAATMIAIADAIAAELATASGAGYFAPLTVAPVRSYASWDNKLETLGTTKVDVVPLDMQARFPARGHLGYEVQTSVLVRRLFGASDRDSDGQLLNASVDPFLVLLQQIYELFAPSYPGHDGRPLATIPGAAWLPPTMSATEGSQFRAMYSRTMLRTNSQFSGFVVLAFRVMKQAQQ